DDAGGLAVVPARYGPDYEVSELRLGVRDWVAAYALPPGQRMMVAAFPGRPFDWERSFHCHFVTTYGSMGRGTGNAYGEMPPEGVIASWAQTFDIVFLSFEGLYERKRPGSQYPHPGGPYTVANPAEFRRFVSTARRYGMKVTPYTSPYNCITQPQDLESYLAQVAALQRDFQIGGVYVDGLLTDTTHRRGVDDKLGSWEIVRRLREMFGADGVILLHGTAIGNPVGVLPNTDTYCDVVLCGEGVESHAVDEPYVRYRVRKYGISNTVGMWCCKIEGISWPERLRATLAMNCRMRWGSYVPMREPPPNNRYTWNTKLDWWYVQYRRALREVEERYHATVRSPPSGRPGP
ncbi:MAG TPA: hypothetical protein PLQ87_13985, partial [Phycisphaerae bacterium]|nr:hypothetical protein [Phycisphaerae bacterium]